MASVDIGSQALLIDGHTSVERWEADCQRALAALTVVAFGCRVLEVGYGLGMASAAIQRFKPSLHVILEARNEIAIHALSGGQARRRHVFQIDWQRAQELLRPHSFDAIVFDADPEVPADVGWGPREVSAWVEPAARLMRPLMAAHGRFGFIDFTAKAVAQSSFGNLLAELGFSAERKRQSVQPPATCRYATGRSAEIVVLAWISTAQG